MKHMMRWSHYTLLAALTVAAHSAGCAKAAGDSVDDVADADAPGPGSDSPADSAPDQADAESTGGLADANTDPSMCTRAPCDLAPQCGCPTGQACDLDPANLATGATECRLVNKAGDATATCADSDECSAGFVCLLSDRQCRQYCTEDSHCPGDGGGCVITLTYNGGTPIPDATLCTKHCDPTSDPADGCPDGLACRLLLAGTGNQFVSDCQTPGAGGNNADCATNGTADCVGGYACVTIGTQQRCKKNCVVGGANTCTTGTCQAFAAPKPVLGAIEYGFCN